MKFQIISSGSKGNSTIIVCNHTKIIIDVGITYKLLKETIENNNLSIDDFSSILITHSHNDHIKGLSVLLKHTNIMVYIPKAMYEELKDIVPQERCVFIEDNFNIDDVEIELIHTSHDTKVSVGYIITYQNKSLVYITDTGYINRKYLAKIINKDCYVMESNHDEKMLMDGPYTRYLKERVISDVGHLSNTTAAKYLAKVIGTKTKNIILAHISETNNTYDLALKTAKDIINNENINIMVAKQCIKTPVIEV